MVSGVSESSLNSGTAVPDHLVRAAVFQRPHQMVRSESHCLTGHFRPHDHAFLELAFIFDGAGTHRTVHGERPLTRGQVFILSPNVWHAYLACQELHVYNCYVSEDVLKRELGWTLEDPLLGRLFWTRSSVLDRTGAITATLQDSALEQCRLHLRALDESQHAISGRGELLGHLLLLLSVVAEHVQPPLGPLEAVTVPAGVQAWADALEHDLAKPWTVDALARQTGQDASRLSRDFTRTLGTPPLAYLKRARLERASTLLVQTVRPIADIGAEVGWPDANLFARHFRAHFGMCASAYRRSLTDLADDL